jgi:hypothetical protein
MRTVILNSTDIVEGTNNSILQYQFAGGNINLKKGQKVALASIQMYNSTFNITTANKNNSFSYIWTDGTTNVVTIPNGFYDILALNNYLHFAMVQNKHYLVSSTGDFVYFITLTTNATRYSVELNCFTLNTTLATANGWTLPAGATWAIPNPNLIVPSLIVPSAATSNFGLVIGFAAGTYPNAPITGVSPAYVQTPAYTATQVFLSTITPQVTPISSFIVTCSLVNNNYAVPNNLIYSFAPQGTIGEQFTITPNQYVFIDVLPAQYNTFQVQFIDQNFRPVAFQDPNMIIQIIISDPEDNLGL